MTSWSRPRSSPPTPRRRPSRRAWRPPSSQATESISCGRRRPTIPGVAEYAIYRDDVAIGLVPGNRTTFSDTSVLPLTTYSYSVDAADPGGRRSARSSPSLAVTTPALDPPPPSGGTNVLVAAGDICQVAPTNCAGTASLVEASAPDVAVTLGDNQYSFGTLAQYLASYDLEWGRFKDVTKPSPGNHEWKTPSAQGYKDYFGASFLTNGGTWYSFDLGCVAHRLARQSMSFDRRMRAGKPRTCVASARPRERRTRLHAGVLAQAEILLGDQPRERHLQPAVLGPPRP